MNLIWQRKNRRTITLQVYSLCQGEYNASFRWAYTSFFNIQIHELQIHSSIPFYTIYILQNMLCVEAPEANILVCKGYKCTKIKHQTIYFCKIKWLAATIISSNCLELLRLQQQSSHGNRSSYNKLRLIQQTHSIQAHAQFSNPNCVACASSTSTMAMERVDDCNNIVKLA